MPQPLAVPVGLDAATRHQRASVVPVAALHGHDLTLAIALFIVECVNEAAGFSGEKLDA
ncbi:MULTISPECIES: hypothetical protein [Sinorhizobium]|uniref:hypothetical protein n=1 Tax=Sinorhizobium TaxID=28105 RepID=UPI0001E4B8B4|nr:MULTISPECIES: hypothetical protein [Sinorhizobium]AEG04619.1 hypothetical protein SinmeB_1709 [Sinorhizobium meliloti BL225C]MDE3757840.1 hypothetical protein [Sinorhizobium meliloti]MDE4545565.1 hypothetical protein [Sinorhizobium meliloti]MDE4573411.1 hypothetical protein [Sinorhizobium meliloti]SDX51180.1 hypothetical protein SAMN04244576_01891 [Sinorhizobium meliloti]